MPISEFHFAFCGIATVAATLGYACARRLGAVRSLSAHNEPPPTADVEAGHSEERSLKRKLGDSDEHDVDAEEHSRPIKRNRTPPTDRPELDEDFNQEWEVVVAPPPYEEATGPRQSPEPVQDHSKVSPTVEQDIKSVREPSPPPAPQPEQKGAEAPRCSTPQVTLSPNEPEPETVPPRPVTPPKPCIPAQTKQINPFSAFSGSSSPFASYSNASGASPFALSGQSIKATPAWRRNSENESDAFGQANSASALAPSPSDALSSIAAKSPIHSQSKDVLGVSGETQSLTKATSHVTGEEDETVEADLKGVKLFVKRGRREFTDGIYGHVKILTRKPTPQNTGNEDSQATHSRTRLLFRRDPLGQVSMNVGLQSTVRCHFDGVENILRVILMEPTTTEGKSSKEDVVIYALKHGRAQKAEFQSFAKALCDHEGLGSRLSNRTRGDVAAS